MGAIVGTAQAFPFAALPAVSRDEIRAAVRLRDTAARFVRAEDVATALSELAGETIALRVRRTRAHAAAPPTDGVAVTFSLPDEAGLERAVIVDVERTLAAVLVARALRQRSPRIVDGAQPASPALAGALAALLHATLRRAHAGVPLRVVAAGPSPMLTRDFAGVHGAVMTAWLTVLVGADAFEARVSIPETLAWVPPPRPLSAEDLGLLGDVPIAVPLVATSCFVERTTLAALRLGDVLVVPGFSPGRVALVAPTSERGLAARLGDDGRLVLGSGPLESHPWDPPLGGAMSGENATLNVVEVVEEAPVVVRVELGAVEMPARAWAALAPGDVVTLGRKLGEPAILRVAGTEIARGELVQVDGEYGVRILGRTGGG